MGQDHAETVTATLLEALRQIERIEVYSKDAPGYSDALTDARQIARAAIATVEGRE